jgi:type IV pilus assembly protein PilV
MSQNLTAARMRGDASVLASQLIGQMWVDQGNLASYAVSDTACTSASYLACQEWLAGVRQKLPKAGAAVRVDHGRVDIRLAWTVPGQEPAFYDLQSTVSK